MPKKPQARTSRSADMAAQLAAKGLTWNGVQLVPVDAPPEPTYDEPTYNDPGVGSAGSLDDSPDWLSLNAELDREMGLRRTDAERQKSYAMAERDRQLSELAMKGELEREGIAGSMEARGLYRSGETEQTMARQRANELSRGAALQGGASQRVADIEMALAIQEAEANRRRAEARASFLARGYTA